MDRDPDHDERPRIRPGHPRLQGALVVIGVVLLLIVLAALSTFGTI